MNWHSSLKSFAQYAWARYGWYVYSTVISHALNKKTTKLKKKTVIAL